MSRVTFFAYFLAVMIAVTGCVRSNTKRPPDTDLPEDPPHGSPDTPPLSTLTTPALQLSALANLAGDPLPRVEVGPINAIGVQVLPLLDVIASEQGIAMAIEGGIGDAWANRVINYSDPRMRPLDEVVETITRNAGVFYRYENGILIVEPERNFTITVPRIGNSLNELATTFGGLGAEDVQVDNIGGILTFNANRREIEEINQYLSRFWSTRDMIIFDAWFFEISLTDDNSVGINWDSIEWANVLGSQLDVNTSFSGGSVANGVTIGITGTEGDLTVDGVLGFLETQGDVRALSKPTLTVLSGSTASIQVGETQQYVSRLASIVDGGIEQTTSEPDTLETGIDMEITSSYSDGLVHLELDLRLETLLRFEEFDAADATLRLPVTSLREIETDAHARPGDLILIGGLIQDRAEQARDRIAMIGVPLRNQLDRERIELIIMLRPRVIRFRPESI